jgi:hypothetical protein
VLGTPQMPLATPVNKVPRYFVDGGSGMEVYLGQEVE